MCDFYKQELGEERTKDEIQQGRANYRYLFMTTLGLFLLRFMYSAIKYSDADIFYVGLPAYILDCPSPAISEGKLCFETYIYFAFSLRITLSDAMTPLITKY
jgi:hypothetical protein